MPTPSAPEPHPVSQRLRRLRAIDGRARWVGYTISAVAHLLVVLFYAGIAGPPTVRVNPRPGESSTPMSGLELLNLVEEMEESEASDDETELIDDPEVIPARPLVPVEPTPTEAAGAPGEEEEARPPRSIAAGPLGPSAAEQLRVRTYDARLWDFSSDIYEPTTERRLTAELAGRIDIWADSLAAALERDARTTDWTWTDAEGNRWGVSPGKLHLGSITLPLPFGFGIPPGRFEEYMERQYIDRELARNALTGVILETWQDRAAAIKRRRDRERAEAAERSGPRRIVPDTARGGGGR